jgi:hypothetical protein
MVLTLKRWKSRSPPGIVAGEHAGDNPFTVKGLSLTGWPFWRLLRSHAEMTPRPQNHQVLPGQRGREAPPVRQVPEGDAGWSSPVARQAHNLKVVGSNPTPATTPLFPNQPFRKERLFF